MGKFRGKEEYLQWKAQQEATSPGAKKSATPRLLGLKGIIATVLLTGLAGLAMHSLYKDRQTKFQLELLRQEQESLAAANAQLRLQLDQEEKNRGIEAERQRLAQESSAVAVDGSDCG